MHVFNGAVKFLYVFTSGFLVQAVYILCNHARKAAARLQRGNDFMRFIGFGFVHTGKKDFFHFLPAAFGVFIKKIYFYEFRVVCIPQASPARKRRDAAFHRHARPRKRHAATGVFN